MKNSDSLSPFLSSFPPRKAFSLSKFVYILVRKFKLKKDSVFDYAVMLQVLVCKIVRPKKTN
jgi:hypothetical protein